MKLRGAVAENSSITQEIANMKMTLMKLQTERVKAGGRAAHEVDAALAKVPFTEATTALHLTSIYPVFLVHI